MSAYDAQKIADEQGLDLVKIAPQSVPPICKLMDYDKFRFDSIKKEKEDMEELLKKLLALQRKLRILDKKSQAWDVSLVCAADIEYG